MKKPKTMSDLLVLRDMMSVDDDLSRSNPPHTQMTHPYSYDPFTVWGKRNKKCNNSVYTDRMSLWDFNKFEKIGAKVFGNSGSGGWFDAGSPNGRKGHEKKVEQFLCEYFDDKTIELTRVIQYCNMSTGFPTWRLDYYQAKA